MAMRRQLPGGAEMQGNAYQPTTWRRETLGIAACVSLVLSGCGGGKSADVTLPIDPVESAALCYGATMALTQERVGKGSVPLDDASHALHFALLAGTDGGLDDPAKVVGKLARIGTQDKGLQNGRAACRESECKYGVISVVVVTLTQK